MDYGAAVWDPYHKKDINQLERVQRRAARFICNDYGRESSATTMLSKLDLKPLCNRRQDQRLSLLHKIVYEQIAIPSQQFVEFKTRQSRHTHTMQLKQQFCHTEIFKHSFGPRTVRDWNALPYSIVTYSKHHEFKNALLASQESHRGTNISP